MTLSVISAGVGEQAGLRVAATVNANWRGIYDILVLPHTAGPEPWRTEGLVEGDFLGTGGDGGISVRQWHEVQRIPGVTVAAPIAAVGFLSASGGLPNIAIPMPHRPSLFKAAATFSTSDGLHSIRVADVAGLAYVVPAKRGGRPTFASTFQDAYADRHGVYLQIDQFPNFPALLVAIDPVSEDRLLGRSVFSPLAALPGRQLDSTSTFPLAAIPPAFETDKVRIQAQRLSTEGVYGAAARTPARPVVPLILNAAASPGVTISWRVWRMDGAPQRSAEAVDRAASPILFFKSLYKASDHLNLNGRGRSGWPTSARP